MQYEVTVLATTELELGSILKKAGAKVVKEGKPEKKNMAYQVKKVSVGFYHFALVELDGPKVSELEKRLMSTENVLRVLVVKKD